MSLQLRASGCTSLMDKADGSNTTCQSVPAACECVTCLGSVGSPAGRDKASNFRTSSWQSAGKLSGSLGYQIADASVVTLAIQAATSSLQPPAAHRHTHSCTGTQVQASGRDLRLMQSEAPHSSEGQELLTCACTPLSLLSKIGRKRCTNNQVVLPDLQLLLVLFLMALVIRNGLPRQLEQLQLLPSLDGRCQLGRILGRTRLELQGKIT